MTAAKKRAGLGRGLAALLDDAETEMPAQAATYIPIHRIEPHPDQPRRRFDEDALAELAESIRVHGVLQPILVRPRDNDHYEIIAGERRWRAAQLAGLHEVPAVVRNFGERETLTAAIVENVQRADLNPMEEAKSYRKLHQDFGIAHEAIAAAVGKSRSHISNLIRLLDLPESVQAYVLAGRLTMGHGRAIAGAADPECLAEEVIARGLSVRDAEARAAKSRAEVKTPGVGKRGGSGNADILALERALADTLGLKVSIKHGDAGGRIEIGYAKLEQLDMVCQRLSAGRV